MADGAGLPQTVALGPGADLEVGSATRLELVQADDEAGRAGHEDCGQRSRQARDALTKRIDDGAGLRA